MGAEAFSERFQIQINSKWITKNIRTLPICIYVDKYLNKRSGQTTNSI